MHFLSEPMTADDLIIKTLSNFEFDRGNLKRVSELVGENGVSQLYKEEIPKFKYPTFDFLTYVSTLKTLSLFDTENDAKKSFSKLIGHYSKTNYEQKINVQEAVKAALVKEKKDDIITFFNRINQLDQNRIIYAENSSLYSCAFRYCTKTNRIRLIDASRNTRTTPIDNLDVLSEYEEHAEVIAISIN